MPGPAGPRLLGRPGESPAYWLTALGSSSLCLAGQRHAWLHAGPLAGRCLGAREVGGARPGPRPVAGDGCHIGGRLVLAVRCGRSVRAGGLDGAGGAGHWTSQSAHPARGGEGADVSAGVGGAGGRDRDSPYCPARRTGPATTMDTGPLVMVSPH